MLSNEERQRLNDLFDVYDLVEVLDLQAIDIIEAFEDRIELNEEVMEKITNG